MELKENCHDDCLRTRRDLRSGSETWTRLVGRTGMARLTPCSTSPDVEEDSGTGGPLTLVPGHDSDVDSNTYSQMSTNSGSGSAHRHVTTPTRRTNRSNYSVVRTGVPPHPPVILRYLVTTRTPTTAT